MSESRLVRLRAAIAIGVIGLVASCGFNSDPLLEAMRDDPMASYVPAGYVLEQESLTEEDETHDKEGYVMSEIRRCFVRPQVSATTSPMPEIVASAQGHGWRMAPTARLTQEASITLYKELESSDPTLDRFGAVLTIGQPLAEGEQLALCMTMEPGTTPGWMTLDPST